DREDARVLGGAVAFGPQALEEGVEPDVRDGRDHGEAAVPGLVAPLEVEVDVAGREGDGVGGPEDDVATAAAFEEVAAGAIEGGVFRGFGRFGGLVCRGAFLVLAHDLEGDVAEVVVLADGAADDFPFGFLEGVVCFDDFAFLDVAFDRDLDAVPEAPDVHLEDLGRPVDVDFPVLRPPIDVADGPELAGDADAGSEARLHPPIRESLQGLFRRPPLLTDQCTTATRPSAPSPFSQFFMLPIINGIRAKGGG
ncbi:hypothetical protein Tdes44962_MAKER10295, partial [Teratosphaeria destructans]